ncbi:MAG: glycosyltransferase, partial [Vampirovibrionia bacterium]
CHNKTEEAKAIEQELKQYAINLGIEKYVLFLGTVENMLEVIRSIDICLYPVKSMYNKMDIPLVLLECMAYAKPIILTDIGPLKELVKEDIGFTVEPDDVNSITKYILELLQSNDLRMLKGFNGRKVVQKHFNMKILAKEYEELYHELLNKEI